MESGTITIHLPAVGLHKQLIFCPVNQKLRLQCLHELLPRRELAGGIKKLTGCLPHCHLGILDRNCILKVTLLFPRLAFGNPCQKCSVLPANCGKCGSFSLNFRKVSASCGLANLSNCNCNCVWIAILSVCMRNCALTSSVCACLISMMGGERGLANKSL